MKIDRLIRIQPNNLKPARGRILLSEPFMGDYYFGRSVVLLAEHNDEGSFGLILNKPVKKLINQVTPDFPELEMPLYIGGPVESNRLFFIHTLGEEIDDSVEVIPGLYWGGNMEDILELARIKKLNNENSRFFIGYSGWGAHQMEDELKRNSWAITTATADVLFKTNPEILWKKLTRKLGSDYRLWAKFPVNPNMN
jgi:putative transcriptional regulator